MAMPPTKKILPAKDIIADIRAGMSDSELMSKYQLSRKGLKSAFSKLLKMKLLKEADFYNRPAQEPPPQRQAGLAEDTVVLSDDRETWRLIPKIPIPIYGNNPAIKGEILNFSERGVCMRGISGSVGQKRQFVIMPQEYLPIEPITFEALCVWRTTNHVEGVTVGFQITQISEDAILQLRILLDFMDEEEG
jgi:hypothetical protein